MTEEELIKKLEDCADHPYFGAMTDEQLESGWSKVALAIGADPKMEQPNYTWKDYSQYGVYLFRENMVRPLAVGFASLAILLGGWTGMVGASFDSVPGDVLYPVKIANEKVQLSLAFSDEQKTKLHVEFASKRLDEVVIISSSDSSEKEEQVRIAMNSFTNEIETVNQKIEEMKVSDLEGAAELVKIVDTKVAEYEDVLEQSEVDFADAELTEIASAIEVVEEADTQVVEVMVENQEATQEEGDAEDLQKKFQRDWNEINNRTNLSVGRLASIEDILYEYYLEGEVEYYTTVSEAETALREVKPELHDAMNIMAAGGYRGAFDIIQEIFEVLDGVEDQIATMELEIIAQVSALSQEEETEELKNLGTEEPIEVETEAENKIDLELTEEGSVELAPVATKEAVETDASSDSEL